MIPDLSPLSRRPAAAGNGQASAKFEVPPPPDFRPAVKPKDVFIHPTPYRPAVGRSISQKAGLRYEQHVQEFLKERFGSAYWAEPKVTFRQLKLRSLEPRMCRPDGLITFFDSMVIVEIKVQHMPEAWWQLRKLYQPVLEAYTSKVVRCLEICRSYDPAMPFPEEFELIEDLSSWLQSSSTLGVFRWKP